MNTQPVGYKAKAFEARDLILFILIALGLNWIPAAPVIFGLVSLPTENTGPVLSIAATILILLANISPTLAAFIVTAMTEGRSGVKTLWGRFWNRNLSLKWLLVALLFIPTVRLVANLIYRTLDGQAYPFFHYSDIGAALVAFLIAFGKSGLTEEFGWRGYALPRLQARWNALTSSLIIGTLVTLWHVPAMLLSIGRLYQRNFWEYLGWMFMVSIIYTWIFNNTHGNILATVVFHAMVNTAVVWCCPDYATTAWYLYGSHALAAILIVVIFGPKNLVRQKPAEAIAQARVHAMSD